MRHNTLHPTLALGLTVAMPLAMLSQAAPRTPVSTDVNQPVTVAYSDVPASAEGAMTLDVVVTDKSGAPVEGLAPADFRVIDNKQPGSLVSVKTAEGFAVKPSPPAEVIVVIDAINSSFLTVTKAGTWIRNFLHENDGQLALPTSLVVLSDLGTVASDVPSRDGKVLEKFLDANDPGLRVLKSTQGWQTFSDREQASLKLIDLLAMGEAKRPGRKLVIWVSPGWGMITGPLSSRSKKNNDLLFNYIVSLSTELRAARITLYDIDPLGPRPGFYQFESYLKPADEPAHADFGNILLQVLSRETGGQVMAGNNDLAQLMDRCIADAKSYYEVTFTPPPPGHPNELHELEVLVDKPGLQVRTRTLYYAEPTVVGSTELPANASVETPKPVSH